MSCWQLINIIRGLSILISLLLGLSASPLFISSQWLLLSLLTGLNMLTSGITGFCMCQYIVCKLGFKNTNC